MYILTHLAEISSPSSYKPPFNSAERDITEADAPKIFQILGGPSPWQTYLQHNLHSRQNSLPSRPLRIVTDQEFAKEYKNIFNQYPDADAQGFVDRRNAIIYLREFPQKNFNKSKVGLALHEAVHLFSHPAGKSNKLVSAAYGTFGKGLLEGFTQVVTEDIQTEQSIRPMRWQAYKQFTPVARRFLDVFGPKIIADAYFYGQLDPFIKAVTARLTAGGFHNLRQLTDRGKTQQAIDLIKNLTQTRTVHFQQVFRGVGRGLSEVPSCTSSNCSAISVDRFDKQPADLQRVLAKSFNDPAGWFGNLDPLSRFALTAIYNRLCHYKVWCQVVRVLKVVPGAAPLRLAGHAFQVPGSTPSVYFEAPSGKALVDALMGTRRFCRAHGIGNYFHRGRISLREISGSDSLHVSIGPGNQFDAHIDKFSPVPVRPGSDLCPNDLSPEAAKHIFSEAAVKKGIQLFPDFELTPTVPRPEPTTRQDADLPQPIVGGTYRFPAPRARTQPRRHQEASLLLSPNVVTRIDRAIKEKVRPDALLPPKVRERLAKARWAAETAGPYEEAALRRVRDAAEEDAGNYPEPHSFARILAERMEQARRSHVARAQIDMQQYGSADSNDRKAVAEQIRRIALILRNFLPDQAKSVSAIVVIFGSGKFATREVIKLP